jgi:hypothetical protein
MRNGIGSLGAPITAPLSANPLILDGGEKIGLEDDATDASVRWPLGREGMVVKPLNFITEGRRGITQPAIKCRGAEYLRIIYGPAVTADKRAAQDAIAAMVVGKERRVSRSKETAQTQIGPAFGPEERLC